MRTSMKRAVPAIAATAVIGSWAMASPALAHEHEDQGETTLQAEITELNDSGVWSTAWGTLHGNELTVKIESSGLLEEAPHAQHIHIGGQNQCPDPNMEGTGFEGAIRTTDAHDDYGMIAASLTTEGDTSPDSGLAVDRFPVGNAMYERTFEVSDDVAADIAEGKGVIVLHGVDHNGSGTYDGDQASDLDPSLPSEATDPAACGEFVVSQMADMPEGGAETGAGTTAGVEHAGLLALGGLTVAGAATGFGVMRRRHSDA